MREARNAHALGALPWAHALGMHYHGRIALGVHAALGMRCLGHAHTKACYPGLACTWVCTVCVHTTWLRGHECAQL